MPQKLTTTACFIQKDETGCSGKFLRHFYDYTFRSVYMSSNTLLYFANQNYLAYIYITMSLLELL